MKIRSTSTPPDAAAADTSVAEATPALVRPSVGTDIEVLGNQAQHQVPHATSHHIGLAARAVQSVEDLQGMPIDVLARHRMLAARQDSR